MSEDDDDDDGDSGSGSASGGGGGGGGDEGKVEGEAGGEVLGSSWLGRLRDAAAAGGGTRMRMRGRILVAASHWALSGALRAAAAAAAAAAAVGEGAPDAEVVSGPAAAEAAGALAEIRRGSRGGVSTAVRASAAAEDEPEAARRERLAVMLAVVAALAPPPGVRRAGGSGAADDVDAAADAEAAAVRFSSAALLADLASEREAARGFEGQLAELCAGTDLAPPHEEVPGLPAALLASLAAPARAPPVAAAALQGELSRSLAGGAGALGEAEAGEEAAFWSLLSSAQAEAAAAKRSGDAIDLMAGGFDLATG